LAKVCARLRPSASVSVFSSRALAKAGAKLSSRLNSSIIFLLLRLRVSCDQRLQLGAAGRRRARAEPDPMRRCEFARRHRPENFRREAERAKGEGHRFGNEAAGAAAYAGGGQGRGGGSGICAGAKAALISAPSAATRLGRAAAGQSAA